MPHANVKLLPGINVTETPALNQAGISESNLIRFVPDERIGALIQKLGGWTKYPEPNQDVGSIKLPAIPRALWSWQDTNANKYLGVGTEYQIGNLQSYLGVISDGVLDDITPRKIVSNQIISTAGGGVSTVVTTSGSNKVKLKDTSVTVNNFTSVFIGTPIAAGGLVLKGTYQCEFVSATEYNVYATDIFGNPQYATSSVSTGVVPQFDAVTGSSTITVTLANHGYIVGSTFGAVVPTTIRGLTIYGNYLVLTVPTANTFTIGAASQANSTGSATVFQNNGLANYTYNVGISPVPIQTGYGTNSAGYGGNGYGVGNAITPSTGTPITTTDWSLDNWGETFLACPAPYNSIILAVTGASGNGTTATLTFSTSYLITVGSTISVSGLTPTGYNGTYVVTASTTNTVSYANATTGFGATVSWINNSLVTVAWVNSSSAVVTWISTPPATGIISVSGTNSGALYSPIYEWQPTSGNPIATAIPQAPICNDGMFVAMPQRQIIAWGSTFSGIQDPLLIRWCDVENYGSWIAQATNQAGSYRIPKGSKIVCGIQGPQQGLIWTDVSLWAMQYIGPPGVYGFNEIGTGCGLISRKAATSMNGIVYWMGQSQFYRLAGQGVEIIPCPVWDVIFQDLDQSNKDKIRIAANSRFGEITWYYPTMSNGGENNAYVKYNVFLQRWDYGTLSRTSWINESVLGPPIGGSPDQYLYQHETSTDADGQPLDASFRTGYFALDEANFKTYIDEIWPDMRWGYYGGEQNATVNMTFYVTDFPGQSPRVYGPYPITQSVGTIYPRFRGRLVSIALSNKGVGSFWRIGNIRYRYQPDGRY
jgi:hypothetical protein